MSLRDRDIREPLHYWLQARYADSPNTEILHELKMPHPSARIDVAVVNGELTGYEIKSDVDTLSRLEQLEPAFSAVFDRVSIVTTARRLRATECRVPDWWGILIASDAVGGVKFICKRRARKNKSAGVANLLYVLTRPELMEIARKSGAQSGYSKMRQAQLIDAIICSGSKPQIRAITRDILRRRPSFSYSVSPSSSSSAS